MIRLEVRVVVVIADAKREVDNLMRDGAGALALAHARKAPLHLAGLPTGPRLVARDHPARFGFIGIAPCLGNIIPGLELHLAELLPYAGFVVARVDAQDDIVGILDVAGVCAPQGVDVGLQAAIGGEAAWNAVLLSPLVEPVLEEILG